MKGLLAFVLLAVSAGAPPPVCKGRVATGYDPRRDEPPSPRALAEVQSAYDVLCPERACGAGSLHANPSVGNNAFTFVSRVDGGPGFRAKIVYGRAFLDHLNRRFGPGASFGVLAHEVGHHLTAAKALRRRMDSSWDEELRADWLAGCALGRSGQDLDALESALKALASVATPTHPDFRRRIPVLRQGYRECRGQAFAAYSARRPFGLAGALGPADRGCFRYGYRLEQEIARLGPLGPRLRFSEGFSDRARCEAARADRPDRRSKPCRCLSASEVP